MLFLLGGGGWTRYILFLICSDVYSRKPENLVVDIILHYLTIGYVFQQLTERVNWTCLYLWSNGNFYCLPLCRTTSYYNSFIPSTIKLCNDLDAEIKNSSVLSIFKSKLKKTTKCTQSLQTLYFWQKERKYLLFYVNYGIKLVIWMLTYLRII